MEISGWGERRRREEGIEIAGCRGKKERGRDGDKLGGEKGKGGRNGWDK